MLRQGFGARTGHAERSATASAGLYAVALPTACSCLETSTTSTVSEASPSLESSPSPNPTSDLDAGQVLKNLLQISWQIHDPRRVLVNQYC